MNAGIRSAAQNRALRGAGAASERTVPHHESMRWAARPPTPNLSMQAWFQSCSCSPWLCISGAISIPPWGRTCAAAAGPCVLLMPSINFISSSAASYSCMVATSSVITAEVMGAWLKLSKHRSAVAGTKSEGLGGILLLVAIKALADHPMRMFAAS